MQTRRDIGARATQLQKLGTMRRTLFGLGVFISAATASQAAAAQDNPLHLNRALGVINAFQVICTLEPLSFERIDQKATAMGIASAQPIRSVSHKHDNTQQRLVR